MIKFGLLLTSLCLAATCSAADSVAGEYRLSMPEIGSGLLLRPDQTFEYFFIYGAADYSAKGTWRNENGTVVLNTPADQEPPFRLVRSARGNASEIRVHVQGPNGQGVQHIDVKIGDNLEERTDQDGVAVLPRQGSPKALSIHVPVYDVEAGPFPIAADANEYWFEINGKAITQLKFRDERLQISGNTLQMTFWKGDKPLVYRKR